MNHLSKVFENSQKHDNLRILACIYIDRYNIYIYTRILRLGWGIIKGPSTLVPFPPPRTDCKIPSGFGENASLVFPCRVILLAQHSATTATMILT